MEPIIEPKPKPLYTSDLTRRLLAKIDEKRNAPFNGKASAGKRFSLAGLARDSGLKYWSVVAYVIRRNTKISVQVFDSLLYGMKLSVIDLLEPHEVAQRYSEFDRRARHHIRVRANGKPSTSTKGNPRSKNVTPSTSISLDADQEAS